MTPVKSSRSRHVISTSSTLTIRNRQLSRCSGSGRRKSVSQILRNPKLRRGSESDIAGPSGVFLGRLVVLPPSARMQNIRSIGDDLPSEQIPCKINLAGLAMRKSRQKVAKKRHRPHDRPVRFRWGPDTVWTSNQYVRGPAAGAFVGQFWRVSSTTPPVVARPNCIRPGRQYTYDSPSVWRTARLTVSTRDRGGRIHAEPCGIAIDPADQYTY